MEIHRSLILIISLLGLMGCRGESPSSSVRSSAKPIGSRATVVDSFSGIRIQSYDSDGLSWELDSPRVISTPKKYVSQVFDVVIRQFDEGRQSMSITADEAILVALLDDTVVLSPRSYYGSPKMAAGDMFFRGNVVVISTEGTRVDTDWLEYKRKEDLIVSTAPVKIVREDSITYGTGLEATADLQRLKIFDQTVIIQGEDDEFLPGDEDETSNGG